MKTFVKTFSSMIFVMLTVLNVAAIVFYGLCIHYENEELRDLTPLGEAHDLDFFSSLFGYPVIMFVILIFLTLIIVTLFELVLKTVFFLQSLKDSSFNMFIVLSGTGLIEMIINGIAFLFFVIPSCAQLSRFDQDILNKYSLILFFICVIILLCLILDLLFSVRCADTIRREKEGG